MDAFSQLIEDFELLEEWEDRYRYVIELGRTLAPLDEVLRTRETKVQGCVSQVWLHTTVDASDPNDPILVFTGDSDAHIVRGLIAILFMMCSGQSARTILETDTIARLGELGLEDHLTPQRSNGLRSMVERIKTDARDALSESAGV